MFGCQLDTFPYLAMALSQSLVFKSTTSENNEHHDEQCVLYKPPCTVQCTNSPRLLDSFFKPRLGRLQMPSTSKNLQIIPEEDEPRSSISSSPLRPETNIKRTFSTSYIEVSLAADSDDVDNNNNDDDEQHDLLSLPRPGPAPRPPVTSPKSTAYDTRSGATSPTPSTSSSSSSCSPSTPTSSDDESPMMRFNPRRSSIRPLNIIKNNYSQTPAPMMTSFIESDTDEEDESDLAEWYSREFSKILSSNSPLVPSFPKQQPSRPESLSLEPLITEVVIPITQPLNPPKRTGALLRTHKRSRSAPKEAPPPVPAIPVQFLLPSSAVGAAPSIPEIVELPPSPPRRRRALSLRRPPPRMSIPDDCLADGFVNGEDDESSWSSALDFAVYEHPSPAIISPLVAQHLSSSVLDLPDSPGSMYAQTSALPCSSYLFEDEGFGEIEFAVEDVKFDFSMPMHLPLSLPNSPIDLETDFALGLEELWNSQEAAGGGADELVLPVIAVSDADKIQKTNRLSRSPLSLTAGLLLNLRLRSRRRPPRPHRSIRTTTLTLTRISINQRTGLCSARNGAARRSLLCMKNMRPGPSSPLRTS